MAFVIDPNSKSQVSCLYKKKSFFFDTKFYHYHHFHSKNDTKRK